MMKHLDETLRQASRSQMTFLLHLFESDEHVGCAMGTTDGAAVVTLSKRGLIEPCGKVDGNLQWRLKVEFTEEQIDYIREIVER